LTQGVVGLPTHAALRKKCPLVAPSGPSLSVPKSLRPAICNRSFRARIKAVETAEGIPDPQNAASSISAGRQSFADKDFAKALEYFELSFTLPGTGIKRFRCRLPVMVASNYVAKKIVSSDLLDDLCFSSSPFLGPARRIKSLYFWILLDHAGTSHQR
jgi:hypothetical protein